MKGPKISRRTKPAQPERVKKPVSGPAPKPRFVSYIESDPCSYKAPSTSQTMTSVSNQSSVFDNEFGIRNVTMCPPP